MENGRLVGLAIGATLLMMVKGDSASQFLYSDIFSASETGRKRWDIGNFRLDDSANIGGGNPLLTELKVCVQTNYNTFVNLVCPSDHMVIIAQATYLRTHVPGCHPSYEDACVASDISSQLTMPCFFRLGTCKIKLMVAQIPVCHKGAALYRGDPYFHVLYKCEPMMLSGNPPSQTADMCSHTRVTGSLVYLWNTNFPQYTLERTCRCMVTIGQNAQMEVKLPHFKAHQQQPNGCPQVIHFWSGKDVHSVCSEVDDSFEPLEIYVNSTLYVEFDNPLQQMTQFWISLRVHHNQRMIVRCGADLIFPPRPMGPPPIGSEKHYPESTSLPPHFAVSTSSSSTSPPTSSTALEEAGGGYTNHPHHTIGYIPVIAGAVGATLLVVLIVMVIVFGLKRRRKRDQPPKPQPTVPAAEVDFAFDNEIYMTDGTRVAVHAHPPQHVVHARITTTSQRPPDPATTPRDKTPATTDKKRFIALEAPKSTVVQNPYAGLPTKSPTKSLSDILAKEPEKEDKGSLQSPSKHSISDGEYEDLKDFNHVYKTLAKQHEMTLDETVLSEP